MSQRGRSATTRNTARTTGRTAGHLLVTSRPTQWPKNLLVAAAPLAGGALVHGPAAAATAFAVLAFVLASSGTYLVNDALDVVTDASHPHKRRRPVAAGHLSPGTAIVAGAALAVFALALGAAVAPALVAVLAAYLITTAAYCRVLKKVAWLEIAVVAAGFVLRALAGAAATGVPASRYLLVVTAACALVVVAGKRLSELRLLGRAAGLHRAVLARYSRRGLTVVLLGAAVLAVAAYLGWVSGDSGSARNIASLASAVPFFGVLLRFGALVRAGSGGAPEQVLARDRPTQLLVFVWLVLFALGSEHV